MLSFDPSDDDADEPTEIPSEYSHHSDMMNRTVEPLLLPPFVSEVAPTDDEGFESLSCADSFADGVNEPTRIQKRAPSKVCTV